LRTKKPEQKNRRFGEGEPNIGRTIEEERTLSRGTPRGDPNGPNGGRQP